MGPLGVLEGLAGSGGGQEGQEGEPQSLAATLGTLLTFLLLIEPQVFVFPWDHDVYPASLIRLEEHCFRWDLYRSSSGPSLRAGICFPACPQAVIGFPQIL